MKSKETVNSKYFPAFFGSLFPAGFGSQKPAFHITAEICWFYYTVYRNIWYNIYMDKTAYFSIPIDVTHGRGYVYSLQYHIVWVTKYRKPIFIGEIEADVKKYLIETLKSLDMKILAMEIMPDHIHLLVDCKPQLKLSDAIKILKGNTARWLFLKHPEIKKQLWGGHLWNPSYFVATVSDRTLEQVKEYVNNQKSN